MFLARYHHHLRAHAFKISLGISALALVALLVGVRRASAESAASPPVIVQVAHATTSDVPIYLTGLGTVQAYNTVTLRTQVEGQLQAVHFTEGQTVKKGDVLAEIDPRTFQAALEQAEAKLQQDQANLDNANLILNRYAILARQDFASQQALDNQRSTVEQLKALIAQDNASKDAAAVQLSYTKLISPIDGRTGIRQIDVGNIVHPSDAAGIVVITQTQPISVISTLPEDTLPLVRAALKAGPVPMTAFTKDGATRLGDGTLSLINNVINQASGTLQLKSTFPNQDEALWPGQFVTVRLQQQIAKGALTIPSTAIQRGQNGFFVYRVGPGDVVDAPTISVGQIFDGRAIVTAGLNVNDTIVTSGGYDLEPGVKVAITAAPAAAAER